MYRFRAKSVVEHEFKMASVLDNLTSFYSHPPYFIRITVELLLILFTG